MTLHGQITVDRGSRFTLELELTAERGETVGLLGPNGAGKSSALRVLAGLLPLSAGRIELDGQVNVAFGLRARGMHLLLDEPLAALDASTRIQVHAQLLTTWSTTRAPPCWSPTTRWTRW